MAKGGAKCGRGSWTDGGDWEDRGDGGDPIWEAIAQTLVGIVEDDATLMKIRHYLYKGSKNIDFKGGDLAVMINEYTENVLVSLFTGFGDQEWMITGQADFLLALDAGIRKVFPVKVMKLLDEATYEETLRAAHDKIFEENRVYPMQTDAVKAVVTGPKITKRVYNAVDAGRNDAYNGLGNAWEAQGPLEDYTCRWIDRTIAHLSEENDGVPEQYLPMEAASTMFHQLLDTGCTPVALVAETGAPPQDWAVVDAALAQAYEAYTKVEGMKRPATGIVKAKVVAQAWPAPAAGKAAGKAAKGSYGKAASIGGWGAEGGGDAWGGKGGDAWGGKAAADAWGPYGGGGQG